MFSSVLFNRPIAVCVCVCVCVCFPLCICAHEVSEFCTARACECMRVPALIGKSIKLDSSILHLKLMGRHNSIKWKGLEMVLEIEALKSRRKSSRSQARCRRGGCGSTE